MAMHRKRKVFVCEECKSTKVCLDVTTYQCLACGHDGLLPPTEIGKLILGCQMEDES